MMTQCDEGHVLALQRMVAHCNWLMLDGETPPQGRAEHRALIDYMEGLLERMKEPAEEDARRVAV